MGIRVAQNSDQLRRYRNMLLMIVILLPGKPCKYLLYRKILFIFYIINSLNVRKCNQQVPEILFVLPYYPLF